MWLLSGWTELDHFRVARIHGAFRHDFLMPADARLGRLERASADDVDFGECFRDWKNHLGDAEQMLGRLSLESSPCALLTHEPLVNLSVSARSSLSRTMDRLVNLAQPFSDSGERETHDLISTLRSRSEELSGHRRVSLGAARDLWVQFTHLHNLLDAMPYGIWMP